MTWLILFSLSLSPVRPLESLLYILITFPRTRTWILELADATAETSPRSFHKILCIGSLLRTIEGLMTIDSSLSNLETNYPEARVNCACTWFRNSTAKETIRAGLRDLYVAARYEICRPNIRRDTRSSRVAAPVGTRTKSKDSLFLVLTLRSFSLLLSPRF